MVYTFRQKTGGRTDACYRHLSSVINPNRAQLFSAQPFIFPRLAGKVHLELIPQLPNMISALDGPQFQLVRCPATTSAPGEFHAQSSRSSVRACYTLRSFPYGSNSAQKDLHSHDWRSTRRQRCTNCSAIH